MAPRARHRAGHGHAKHGNPADLAAFIRRQLSPGRAAWQKPAAVMRALGLRRGEVVADMGAGPGYFTLRLARAVGASGHVYAVDPEAAVLQVLRRRLAAAGLSHVTPVLGGDDDPALPAGRCALVLLVNAYHHVRRGRAFLGRLARALAPGGRIANIDFDRRDTPVGPPVKHRIDRDSFLRDARRAGLMVVATHDFLPYQYFVVLRARRRKS
jgi:ubiquinone/menaquinone biosynthesis C-methylase UbiE